MSNLLDDELQLERLKLKLAINQEVEQTVRRHAQTAATV